MVGYACVEIPELMPTGPSRWRTSRAALLAQVRKEGVIPYLRPDGKSQVTIEYHLGKPRKAVCIVERIMIPVSNTPLSKPTSAVTSSTPSSPGNS